MNSLFLSTKYGDDLVYNERFIQTMLMVNMEYLNLSENDTQIINHENIIVSKTIQYITNNISSKIFKISSSLSKVTKALLYFEAFLVEAI